MINKNILRPFVEKSSIKKQRSLIEAKKIKEKIQCGIREVAIFYDNLVSPPSYGDFLHVVILARVFVVKGLHVTFFIINKEFRDDWELLNNYTKINGMVDEQIILAKNLLEGTKIKVVSWKELKSNYGNSLHNYIIPFKEHIYNRQPIYNHSFCLISQLLNDVQSEKKDSGLFSCENFQSKTKNSIPEPYITWHCRYSEKWGSDRNLTENEFILIHEFLRSRFKNHSLIIISDEIGCKHFKTFSERRNFKLLFSKDYSPNFLGDAKLILGSKFYFALRGGGISTFAIYSNIPYMIICPIIHDISWKPGQYVPWQTKQQVLIEGTTLLPEIFDLTDQLIKIVKSLNHT